jgi:hypothetical protein
MTLPMAGLLSQFGANDFKTAFLHLTFRQNKIAGQNE